MHDTVIPMEMDIVEDTMEEMDISAQRELPIPRVVLLQELQVLPALDVEVHLAVLTKEDFKEEDMDADVAVEDEVVDAADVLQAKLQAEARARCEHSNYHDELACQLPGPLQRFVVPIGHSRSSRYPMMHRYVKDPKAAREVCFDEIEADLYKSADELEANVPLDMLYMCKHS